MSHIRDTLKGIGEKAGQAAEWAKEKAGISHPSMSAADMTAIHPQMEVISSCGCRVGTVDHMEGDAIKLTKKDSPDGQHHFIPTGWVARVDEKVHLNKDARETMTGWKPDAAGGGCCGV